MRGSILHLVEFMDLGSGAGVPRKPKSLSLSRDRRTILSIVLSGSVFPLRCLDFLHYISHDPGMVLSDSPLPDSAVTVTPLPSPAELPLSTRVAIKEMNEKWSVPGYGEDITVGWDWRSKIRPHLRAGDIRGMRQAALPAVQLEVIELATGAKNEAVRLQASQLVLSQEGHGPIQRTEALIDFAMMPMDQLQAIAAAKLARLARLDPTFSIAKLLTAARAAVAAVVDETPLEAAIPVEAVVVESSE